MNKIYGKVWSRALQQLVVVSELATCHQAGGSTGTGVSRSLKRVGAGFFTAVAAFAWMGWSGAGRREL